MKATTTKRGGVTINKASLKRLEKKLKSLNDGDFPQELKEYEKRGAGYSELPDNLKNLYCRYWNFDREETDNFVNEMFDLPVSHKLSDKEFQERQKEVKKILDEAIAEYNDPRAVAEREADLRARGIIQ